MNNKIKELIKSMGIIPEDEHYDVAESIIRECLSLFDGSNEMKTVGLISHTTVIGRIKEHFGIK